MTEKVKELLEWKKFSSVEWYTNCFEWLGYIKDVSGLEKVQYMFHCLINNERLSVKQRVDILMFIYPLFNSRVSVVKALYDKKHKRFLFKQKRLMDLIWS